MSESENSDSDSERRSQMDHGLTLDIQGIEIHRLMQEEAHFLVVDDRSVIKSFIQNLLPSYQKIFEKAI